MFAKIQTWLQAFKAKASQDWKDIWNGDKAFFFAAGAIVLIIKFREVLISILLSSMKHIEDESQTKDTDLVKKENTDNAAANSLVQQANEEPTKEKPVTDDWNKQ